VQDVINALEHPDVVAAFESEPKLYGEPGAGRVSDGPYATEILRDGRGFLVGWGCKSCLPEGIAALHDVLWALMLQEGGRGSCAAAFAPQR